MIDILFVRPADDSSAVQVAAWGQAVRHMATTFQTNDLTGAQATRPNIDNIFSNGCRHLFWFGHGTPTELIANGQALIDGNNIRNLDRGLVVAVACHAANTLGRSVGLTTGPKAFLGFDDELGFPAKFPLRMMLAVTRGLHCLLQQGHDISCAADQLRKEFGIARSDYKQNGSSYGLSASETRMAWLFAKSNQYSVQVHGDTNTVL